MKNIIAFSLLFAAVSVSAQDIPAGDTTAKPAITEIGKPDGKKAELKIGKEGGSFTSSDGKVKLIIPEGAISKKTIFSIQPVTNLMPNGNGKAYRLEPSGIQFQKPVQLVFHYDPEESEDTMQLLMGIAMQDDKGQWYGLNKFTLDTVAKTISGNINHFSTWASFDELELLAPKRMKVGRNAELNILRVIRTTELKGITSDLSPLSSWKPPQKVIWRVNGVVKGNAEFGTLRKGKVDESVGNWNWYYAPDNVPDWNPVTLSAELVGASFVINGLTIKNPPLKTKILIYDNAYEVKMTSIIEVPAEVGNTTYLDSGSFVVSLNGAKTKIIEKLNKNTDAKFEIRAGSCTSKQLESGNGYIHMVGVAGMTVTPATTAQLARVKIQFIRTPLIYPLLEFTCDKPPNQYTTTNGMVVKMLAKIMHAYPQSIEFNAREGEWEIYETAYNIDEGTHIEGSVLLKYIIKKLEGEDD